MTHHSAGVIRPLGALVTLGIRLWVAYFLTEVLLRPDDPRFAPARRTARVAAPPKAPGYLRRSYTPASQR